MLGLLVSGLLPVQADLGIALAMSNASHGQVHTNLAALALKVGAQVVNDVLGDLGELANADDVLGSPGHLGVALLDEAVAGDAALGALEIGGQLLAVELLNVTANGAYKLHDLLHSVAGDSAGAQSLWALSGQPHLVRFSLCG